MLTFCVPIFFCSEHLATTSLIKFQTVFLCSLYFFIFIYFSRKQAIKDNFRVGWMCLCVQKRNPASLPCSDYRAHVFIWLSKVTKGELTVRAPVFVCTCVFPEDSKDMLLSHCECWIKLPQEDITLREAILSADNKCHGEEIHFWSWVYIFKSFVRKIYF